MNTVAKALARQAKSKGICKEWHRELKSLTDKREMVAMYVRGIDFCISNDFPSHEYMAKNFKGVMEDFGVFLDDEIRLSNAKTCISHGSTSGILEYSGYGVGEVILKDSSNITIKASGNSFVMIDLFDSPVLNMEVSENAKVCINQYVGDSRVSISRSGAAIVKINKKNSKTYVNRS